MDPGRYGSARRVDAVDPASYDTWPTLASAHQQQRSYCSPCSRRRLTWTAVSVLELILMILTAVYCFFLPEKYLGQIVEKENRGKINELSEWVLRMYGSMICVQIALLVAGIGWGDTISRKIIYWGMLTGDILLVAVQASFVHSRSKWNAVNIAIVTTASAFGLFRIITLILNPKWWEWAPEPIF
ncbi:uncharacterized protein LOC141894658 [Acropora palmata]|uniref:uncharacterized protein LOC141894658 n=1 Tax=Acropora palmata TaxID=6131 RepID=UPI003DA02533